MPKYQKKPVVIESVQLCWATWGEVCDFLDGIINEDNPGRCCADPSDTCGEGKNDGSFEYIEISIPTLEGEHIAKHGDYIIKGVQGEFYPCKPEIFEQTYEKVEEQPRPEDWCRNCAGTGKGLGTHCPRCCGSGYEPSEEE